MVKYAVVVRDINDKEFVCEVITAQTVEHVHYSYRRLQRQHGRKDSKLVAVA